MTRDEAVESGFVAVEYEFGTLDASLARKREIFLRHLNAAGYAIVSKKERPVPNPGTARSITDDNEAQISPHGLLTHRRWLNPDGTYKTGKDLEDELLRVELERLARDMLRLTGSPLKQTRRASWIETISNTAIGFSVAVAANYAVLPLFGYVPRFIDSLAIAAVFTFIAIVRSYLVRRLFENLRVKGILP